jgi:hypothetical protein
MKEIEDDLPGFGYQSTGMENIVTMTEDQMMGREWAVEESEDF